MLKTSLINAIHVWKGSEIIIIVIIFNIITSELIGQLPPSLLCCGICFSVCDRGMISETLCGFNSHLNQRPETHLVKTAVKFWFQFELITSVAVLTTTQPLVWNRVFCIFWQLFELDDFFITRNISFKTSTLSRIRGGEGEGIYHCLIRHRFLNY